MSTGRMTLKKFLEHADTSGGPSSCGVEYYAPDKVKVNKLDNQLLGSSSIRVGSICVVTRKAYMDSKPYSLTVHYKKQPVGVFV